MSGCADLHTHTTASDGTDTPVQLLENVKSAGITVVAITDHDTVSGSVEAMRSNVAGIRLIPGIEFSCRATAGRCHILGLGVDLESHELKDALSRSHELRARKLETRLASLTAMGITFPESEYSALRAMPSAGKPHLANLMVKYGYARDIGEAMSGTLDAIRTPASRLDTSFAVRAILESGGIPVWAHPRGGIGERVGEEEFRALLDELMSYGIRGLECWYSEYPPELCRELSRTAKDRGLLISGGSDYHGSNKSVALGHLNRARESVDASELTVLRELI